MSKKNTNESKPGKPLTTTLEVDIPCLYNALGFYLYKIFPRVNRENREDILQNFFLENYNEVLSRYESSKGKFVTVCKKAIKNKTLNYIKKMDRKHRMEEKAWSLFGAKMNSLNVYVPDWENLRKQVLKAISKITNEKVRAVLLLMLNSSTRAEKRQKKREMQINSNSFNVLYHRGVKQLKKIISKGGQNV